MYIVIECNHINMYYQFNPNQYLISCISNCINKKSNIIYIHTILFYGYENPNYIHATTLVLFGLMLLVPLWTLGNCYLVASGLQCLQQAIYLVEEMQVYQDQVKDGMLQYVASHLPSQGPKKCQGQQYNDGILYGYSIEAGHVPRYEVKGITSIRVPHPRQQLRWCLHSGYDTLN